MYTVRLQRRSEKARKIWVGSGRVVSCNPNLPRFSLRRYYGAVKYFAPFNQTNAWNKEYI